MRRLTTYEQPFPHVYFALLQAARLRGKTCEPAGYSAALGNLWVRMQAVRTAPSLDEFERETDDLLAMLRDRAALGVTPDEERALLDARDWLVCATVRARRALR